MEIKFNKTLKNFEKRTLNFKENSLNVIYAENGTGKSKISDWIFRNYLGLPMEYFDEKQSRTIDVSKKIEIKYENTNELNCVLLRGSSLTIPIGKMHYINTPEKALLGDYLLMKSFFSIPGSFTDFAKNVFTANYFPSKFILPKFFEPVKTKVSFKTAKETYEKVYKVVALFEKNKIKKLPKHGLKATDGSEKNKKIIPEWEYTSCDFGIKIQGNLTDESLDLIKSILEISKNDKIVDFLKEISDDYLEYFKKMKKIGESFNSIRKVKKLLNIVGSTILNLHIKRIPTIKRRVKNLKSNWNFEKGIKKYFPDGRISLWNSNNHAFLSYSLKEDKTNKNLIIKMINFYNSELFLIMEAKVKKMSIYQHWIVVFEKMGIKFETSKINFTSRSGILKMELIDDRFKYLSKGQKDILNIQLRMASIQDSFSKEKNNVLIIDDYGETFDKIKYNIFIRKIEDIRQYFKVTILLFTHDYGIINLLKYMKDIREKHFYTLTKSTFKKHDPVTFEKHSELMQILSTYKKDELFNWPDFLFLLRIFAKHEIATTPNVKVGIKTKNIASLMPETNNYFHDRFNTINQEVHTGILNWVINNLLIISTNSQIKNNNLNNRKKIEKAFGNLEDIKKYKLAPKTYKSKFEVIDIFGNSLYRRIKLERWCFELLKTREHKMPLVFKEIFIRSDEYNNLHNFEYEIALINQQIHVESTNSFVYSDELKTRNFPLVKKIISKKIKIK